MDVSGFSALLLINNKTVCRDSKKFPCNKKIKVNYSIGFCVDVDVDVDVSGYNVPLLIKVYSNVLKYEDAMDSLVPPS